MELDAKDAIVQDLVEIGMKLLGIFYAVCP
jgi:hypothetical protein